MTLGKSPLFSSLSFPLYKPRCPKRKEDGISLNLEWVSLRSLTSGLLYVEGGPNAWMVGGTGGGTLGSLQ